MAVIPNVTQIPPPRMQLLDPRTGFITREWYLWFLNLYNITGGGSSPYSIEDLLIGPPAESTDIQMAFETLSNAVGSVPADMAPELDAAIIALRDQLLTAPSGATPNDVAVLASSLDGLALLPPLSLDNRFYSGVYTPTLTGVANVAATTAYAAQFTRVQNVVTVSGRLEVDATSPSVDTEVLITLPVPSTFTASEQCAGTANVSFVQGMSGAIFADATDWTKALLRYVANDAANRGFSFIFQYQVL